MNWGWIVIAISALSNIRRITRKIESQKSDKEQQDITKMYREELEEKIDNLQKENFNMRVEQIKLKELINEK